MRSPAAGDRPGRPHQLGQRQHVHGEARRRRCALDDGGGRPFAAVAEDDVLVCSTGVIGRFLPREKLADGIPAVLGCLGATAKGFRDAATAMMTTDTFP